MKTGLKWFDVWCNSGLLSVLWWTFGFRTGWGIPFTAVRMKIIVCNWIRGFFFPFFSCSFFIILPFLSSLSSILPILLLCFIYFPSCSSSSHFCFYISSSFSNFSFPLPTLFILPFPYYLLSSLTFWPTQFCVRDQKEVKALGLINPNFMAWGVQEDTRIKNYSTLGFPTLSYGRERWEDGENDQLSSAVVGIKFMTDVEIHLDHKINDGFKELKSGS